MLRTIYREVDFTEVHFTRHMLHRLHEHSADRFAIVVEELRAAWRARMTRLLEGIAAPVHLLWLSRRAPSDGASPQDGPGADPLFVTEEMLTELEPLCASVSICLQTRDRRSPAARGLFFGKGEEGAARLMPGPEDHDRVAAMLAGGAGVTTKARRSGRAFANVRGADQPSFSVSSGTASKRSATRP